MICDSCHLRPATALVTFNPGEPAVSEYACCWLCAAAAEGHYGVVSELPAPEGGDAA